MSASNMANLGIEADPRLERDDQPDPIAPHYYGAYYKTTYVIITQLRLKAFVSGDVKI
jgi:hypothetical protein